MHLDFRRRSGEKSKPCLRADHRVAVIRETGISRDPGAVQRSNRTRAGITTGRGAPGAGNRARVLAAEEKNGEIAPAPDRRIVCPAPGAGFTRHGHRVAER